MATAVKEKTEAERIRDMLPEDRDKRVRGIKFTLPEGTHVAGLQSENVSVKFTGEDTALETAIFIIAGTLGIKPVSRRDGYNSSRGALSQFMWDVREALRPNGYRTGE